jgi:6-phospho-beta-glucosidase
VKLVLMGGGGIRAPLFVESLLRRQAGGGPITHLVLQDIQEQRLDVVFPMAKKLRDDAGSPLELRATTNLDAALEGADYVVTTIRAGFEKGRIQDEKIPLELGCIGQETVGPGGFAMAMRSIPSILDAAERLARTSPRAWIINFTNPAGIVTQALHDAGFSNSVGICDSANTIARDAAALYNVPLSQVQLKVFGLNHCSFAYEVSIGVEKVLARLLANDDYLARFLGLYEKTLLREIGALPNEYLYYYFYAQKAFEAMKCEEHTRGEQIEAMHRQFFSEAFRGGSLIPVQELFKLHQAILLKRHETYMNYAWSETQEGHRPDEKVNTDSEGYAGIALDFITARNGREPKLIVLNYKNQGAIPFFSHNDVAELSFWIEGSKITPVRPGAIHPKVQNLLSEVKAYENLACAGARTKSRITALHALEINPLVRSRELAEKMLFRFAGAHGGLLEEMARDGN